MQGKLSVQLGSSMLCSISVRISVNYVSWSVVSMEIYPPESFFSASRPQNVESFYWPGYKSAFEFVNRDSHIFNNRAKLYSPNLYDVVDLYVVTPNLSTDLDT